MAANTSSSSLVTRRYLSNRIAIGLSMVATAFGLFFLAAILITLLWKGLSAIDWATFTEETPAPPGDDGGGLSNAIFGSFMMTLIGILIATPIGLMAGTYLSEYSRGSKIGEVAKFINDVLLSAPSIIIGLFIYGLLVVPFGHQSAWAGAVALAVIAVPIINRTTQDMLALVPNAMREAAAALGAPRWKVMVSVVWRSARSGITTGVLLAVARISGETAPLLFTAGSNQFWSTDLNNSMANLPVVINNFATGGYEALQRLAWGGALLITVTILILNIVARALAGHRSA